jgi:hypothetical protein
MPAKRDLIKLVREQYNRLLKRRQIVHVARRAMSTNFAAQLLEGIERERAAILERLDVIEAEIAKLQELRHQARQGVLAGIKRQVDPPKTRRRLDGTTYIRPERDRGVGQLTEESIRARRAGRRIWQHMRAFAAEKQHRLNELGELNRLQTRAEAGDLTALVAVAEKFKQPVFMMGISQRVKGPNELWGRPSDAAGNLLPEQALDERGRPLPMPEIPRHDEGALIIDREVRVGE